MADLFWLSNEQWAVIEPFMPRNQPGPERKDDRRIISGILHVITAGCRWCDCPDAYGPVHYNLQPLQQVVPPRLLARDAGRPGQGWMGRGRGRPRQHLCPGPRGQRGARTQGIGPSRGGQTTKVYALTDVLGRPGVLLLTPGNASDVTTAPAVLAEAPGRIRRLAADKGYDADWLRADLRETGITPVIPGKRGRKRKIRHDKRRYRERWRMEATFNRLKDFRRIATRYDKLARNYASTLALAAVIAFWC